MITDMSNNPDYQPENKINGNSTHKVCPLHEYEEYGRSQLTEAQRAQAWHEYLIQIRMLERAERSPF